MSEMRQAVRVGCQILVPQIIECAYILEDFLAGDLTLYQGFGIYFLRGIASDASASAYAVTAITAAFSFNCCTFTLSRVSAAE